MKSRNRRCFLIALLGGLLALVIGTAVAMREKKYEGKTAREWIYLLDPHVDFRVQHDLASEVVVRMGAEALPTIRSILEEPKLPLVQKLKVLAQRFRILPRESIQLADRQYRASRAAYKIAEGADADISSLVPLLSYHLTNSNYADVENGRALAKAGPAGIAVLTNLAASSNRNWRDHAIVSLQHARSAPGVFDTYLRSVNDPDESVRFIALSSLARYPKADPNLLLPLAAEHIQSSNHLDRWAATEIFAAFPADPRSLPALTNALSDTNPTVQSTAKRALGRIDSGKSRR